jgi:hypothetical protein
MQETVKHAERERVKDHKNTGQTETEIAKGRKKHKKCGNESKKDRNLTERQRKK